MTKTPFKYPKRFCGFCDSAARTNHQHIFGKRLLPLLPAKEGTYFEYRPNDVTVSRKKYAGHLIGKQARVVCPTCNNGWMRTLEEEAFPLLRAAVTNDLNRLTLEDQKLLATRVSHIIMTATLGFDDLHFSTKEQRQEFRRTLTPPDDWRMYACEAKVVKVNQFVHFDGLGLLHRDDSEAPKVPNAHTATVVIGKLCIHVLTGRFNRLIKRYTAVKLAQFWPPVGEIDLSETSSLSPLEVYRLAKTPRLLFY